MPKRRVKYFALLIVAVFIAPCLAQTSEPAAPPLHLHSDPLKLTSGQVGLYWYDLSNIVSRYLIERSADEGKSWHIIGNVPGGSATARYEYEDISDQSNANSIQPDTDYVYRLNSAAADRALLTLPLPVHVPQKNLVEAIRGETTLGINDLLKVSFWTATLVAVLLLATSYIPKFLVAAIIFAIFYVIFRITRRLALGSMKRANVDEGIHDLMISLLKWSILGFALVIACDQIGVQIGALLASVSVVGLAVGFAAQDTLANLIGSIVIFWDKPFKIGDWITIDGQYGKVLRVTFRSTRVLTQNGDVISAPNTMVIGNKLLNHSSNPINWVNVPVGIPTAMPIEKARAALVATCAGDARLLPDPAPKVVMDAVNADGVRLFLSFCIKDEGQQADLLQEYLEKAKNALDAIKV
jgi:small conductance mechanosensitive channel